VHRLELERGGAAFASFKATGTKLVEFSASDGRRRDGELSFGP